MYVVCTICASVRTIIAYGDAFSLIQKFISTLVDCNSDLSRVTAPTLDPATGGE